MQAHPVDEFGLSIPRTDTVPWGESGAVARIRVVIDPDQASPQVFRETLEGTWSRDTHGLRIPMPTRREPDRCGSIGLSGMVRVEMRSGLFSERKHAGFTVFGQALARDAERLEFLVIGSARAEMARLAAAFASLREMLPAPPEPGDLAEEDATPRP